LKRNVQRASLYGLFASPSAISDQLSLLAGILPQGAVEILREQVGRLTAGSGAKLGYGFIFGLTVALWSANAGMKAIMDALNVDTVERASNSKDCRKRARRIARGSLFLRHFTPSAGQIGIRQSRVHRACCAGYLVAFPRSTPAFVGWSSICWKHLDRRGRSRS
jgi:hypothetical protein